MRISPVIALSCVLIYLSLSSLGDLVARPSEKVDKGGKSQQSSVAAETHQPSNPDAPLPKGGEESLLTSPQGIAPTGYSEPPTASQPAPAVDAADESANESANEVADEGADEGANEDGAAASFTVQVGSYVEIEEANAQCAHLNSTGIESRMVKVELPGRGTWYRVQAGRFVSREEAARFGAQLRANKTVQNYIVTALETP